ncbi:MAG: nuclear transport factor 2 family protein [Anaerolineae bacterium]
MRRRHLLAAALLPLLLAACGRVPAPTPGVVVVLQPTATPRPPAATAEDEVLAIVTAEGEAVRQQDVDALAGVWAADGRGADAPPTADDESDDREWAGWQAVQQRYLSDVFPNVSEPVLETRPHVILPQVTVEGDEAVVVVFGPDGRTPQDRWQLRRDRGAWRLAALTFNLLPAQ